MQLCRSRSLGVLGTPNQFRHHRLRPCQRLSRTSAAKDDEIVGIGDDVCTEHFTTPGEPPMLQETVHIDVGKQWTRDAALRRAARVAFATSHAPFSIIAVPFLDRRLQPQLDQPQYGAIHDATGHRFEEVVVRNRIEVLGDENSCQTLVTKDGTSSSDAAVTGGMNAPRTTVGSPIPVTPFTVPARTKVIAIIRLAEERYVT